MNLNVPVADLPLVGPFYEERLTKLGIETVENLLLHVPHRYIDFSKSSPIAKTKIGDIVTIRGTVTKIRNQYTRSVKKIQVAEVEDKTGNIACIWFNQPYLIKTLPEGAQVSLSGKIDWFGKKKALISPEFERIIPGQIGLHTGRLIPIYHETKGVSSKWLRRKIKYALVNYYDQIKEYLPEEDLKEYKLEELKNAIHFVHFPKTDIEAEKGKRRLAFNELLFLQLTSIIRKKKWQKNKAVCKLKAEKKNIEKFINSLPFKLTKSQNKVVEEIIKDLKNEFPMNRLLEGDVGSGKTIIAALCTYISFINGYQSIVMAPTQILAQQHYETFKELFKPFKARIELVTSGQKKADLGSTDIFVGTHALINKKVLFEKVAVVVIDEQQKFGVKQREALVKKTGKNVVAPHILTTTATPIPRTVALTFYGDLDLSTLNELPPGRKPISTWVVQPNKRKAAHTWIKNTIKKEDVQAYVVCPLIEDSEKETLQTVKSATKEFGNLKRVFPSLRLDLLHGRLSAKKKDEVISKFKNGETDILVSTPVVEVGIDVAKATIMVVEAADRFGLASLHQLRGRVGRGENKSYCLLFTDSEREKAKARLSAMEKNISGFELAELDLKLRGPGEVFGTKQHGFPELKIASWQDIALIKQAKKMTQKVFGSQKKYGELLNLLNIKVGFLDQTIAKRI